MKPFEEKYTAWIDGTLSAEERAEFEAELGPGREAADEDRASAKKLGDLLRRHVKAPPLKNADFFSHEILRRIEQEARPAASAAPASSGGFRWPFGRLIWATASGLAVGALLMVAIGLLGTGTNPDGSYYAQILETKAGDRGISAVAFHSERENVTVLWLDGLDYLPAEGRR